MINCVLTSSIKYVYINNVYKPADPSPLNYWTHIFMALVYLNDDSLGSILFNSFLRKDFIIFMKSRYWKPSWIVIKLKEITISNTMSLLLRKLNVVLFIFYFTQIKIATKKITQTLNCLLTTGGQ